MIPNQPVPPRNGEEDHAQRDGGGSPPMQRPVIYRARKLRSDMDYPERLLWQSLRLQPSGLKFRRQHPVGPYVVDFCRVAYRVVVDAAGTAEAIAVRATNPLHRPADGPPSRAGEAH